MWGDKVQESFRTLEKKLGYTFRRPDLLRTALTHSSYLNESPDPLEDNERLEYLGDAVLDLAIGDLLFRRFPTAREGELTRWRANLVSTKALADLALKLGIGDALLLGQGEKDNGGQQRPANLAAAFEALVAAVYLDSGMQAVEKFVLPLFERAIERVTAATGPQDARSRLQELVQASLGVTPRYHTIGERGPDHMRVFTVQVLIGEEPCGQGEGHSKRAAAQEAARKAINLLTARGVIPPTET